MRDTRKSYFNNYVSKLKDKEKKQQKKNNNLGSSNSITTFVDSESALFYFYNTTAVAYGKNDFKNRWGNRRLEDNWRWSASSINIKDKESLDQVNAINKDSIFSVDYYIGLIPKDPILIDSINKRRNDAYFRLGSIYKDQFDEYQISNEKLFGLIENKPSENLIPPSKYLIFRIFCVF